MDASSIMQSQQPLIDPEEERRRRQSGGFWDMLSKYGQQQGGLVGMGAGMAADRFGGPPPEEDPRMRARGPQPGLAGGMGPGGPGGGGGGGGVKSMMLRMLMGGG